MSTKREAKLWKEIRWRDLLLAGLITIILTVGYFYISGLEVIGVTLREFLLNIIANLIPTPLLFILAYAFFRHSEELRSEKDADELADKVLQRLIEVIKSQPTGNGNKASRTSIQFSDVHMKLFREFKVSVKSFEEKLNPQKLTVECFYNGENPICIRKISYAGRKLGLDDLLESSYTRTDQGMKALIYKGNVEISRGGHYTFDLILARKWHKDAIESWFEQLGYLYFEIEDGKDTENLQKPI
jgi:hypothetical protein